MGSMEDFHNVKGKPLPTVEPPACACHACAAMCKRACWPLPSEAMALMDAGYGPRLMLDYWTSMDGDIEIVAPASPGNEGQRAPWWPDNGCTMQVNNLCILHDLKSPDGVRLKPYEGRMAAHYTPGEPRQHNYHAIVAAAWDTPEGRAAVDRWQDLMKASS